MKTFKLAYLVGIALLLSGCFALSINPFYQAKDITRNDKIIKAENHLRRLSYRFLMVKTLSDSCDYEYYQRTRSFYANQGFYPLDEVKEIWGEENPCLIMVKVI